MYGMPFHIYNQLNHDYNDDYNEGYNQDFDDFNNYGYNNMGPRHPGHIKYHRNEQYGNAYGNYRGGYAPGRMFMSPEEMGPGPGLFRPNQLNIPPPEKHGSGWLRGHGSRGPMRRRNQIERQNATRLIRFGVPKEIVNNFPKELIHKFRVDHCVLCSQRFDSNTAKHHYSSKHHAKNQKKWLIKQLDAAPLTCESPLKDRNLYCELCDIHITSKQHAESHYAGKTHRAIVEGQKDPRNKILFREDMEERFEQLVEREKKFLENLNMVVKEPPKVKETKEGPPELCCHICKTVVTCSEQMTMHLNGKKHLGKEKQYILKMMRGEVDDQGDKTTYTQENYQQDGKEDADNEECDDGNYEKDEQEEEDNCLKEQ